MAFLVFAIVSIAIGFLAAIIAPGTALAAVICVFGFETLLQAKISYFAIHASIINYVSALIVLVALISAWLRGTVTVRRVTNIEYTIIAFYALMVLTYIWAHNRAWWYSTISYAAPYTFVYMFCFPFVFARLKDFDQGVKATIIFGAIVISLLLFTTPMHQWGRSFNVEEGVVDRYGQIEQGGSPLAVASLAGEVALMTALACWHRGKSLWLLARALILVVACAIIIRTDTRGQLIALVVTLCVMPVFRWPKLDAKLLVGVPMVLGVLLMGIYWGASFSINSWRWNPDHMLQDFSSTRIAFCRTLLWDWIHGSPWHILFGMGAGHSWQVLGVYPHVVAVQILCELGIVGFSLFLLIVGYTTRMFFVCIRHTKNNERARAVVCCLFAVFLFRVALSFKEAGLEFIYTLFLVPVLLNRFQVALAREFKRSRERVHVAYPTGDFALAAEVGR